MTTWLKHVEDWKDCQRCPLAQQRGNICLARGTLPCDVLMVGEAPGISEDALGQPFTGPAGQLLDQIIERALEPWRANSVRCAFTNLVACFPREAKSRGDNEPERGEILECRPRLIEFVNITRPRLIVCVGTLATQYARLGDTVPYVDIVHPAFILARLPLAQKGYATQKCIVQIRTAVNNVVQSPIREWKPWGEGHANVKARREHLQRTYLRAEFGKSNDDIPF